MMREGSLELDGHKHQSTLLNCTHSKEYLMHVDYFCVGL